MNHVSDRPLHGSSRALWFCGWCFLWLIANRAAYGHDPMASWTIGQLQRDAIEVKIKIGAEAVWPLVQESVAPGAVFVLEDFATAGRPMLRAFAPMLQRVTVDGQPLAPEQTDAALVDDHFELTLWYPRPGHGSVRIEQLHVPKMPPDFSSHLTMLGDDGQPFASKILRRDDAALVFALPVVGAAAGAPENTDQVATASHTPSFAAFFKLGVEHILGGYDHLLFLCGLLVACRHVSSIATIVSCFTLAHSLTLALAALNLVSFSPRVVEPMIAASIVFVGIENLVRRGEEPRGRWALAFAFGLVHGFGFAGVLNEIGLGAGGASIVMPLLSFNLGVELGQFAVAALVLPLFWALRRRPRVAARALPATSVVVAVLGLYWLAERTFLS